MKLHQQVNDQLAKNLAAQKSSATMKEENEDMPPMTMNTIKGNYHHTQLVTLLIICQLNKLKV